MPERTRNFGIEIILKGRNSYFKIVKCIQETKQIELQ